MLSKKLTGQSGGSGSLGQLQNIDPRYPQHPHHQPKGYRGNHVSDPLTGGLGFSAVGDSYFCQAISVPGGIMSDAQVVVQFELAARAGRYSKDTGKLAAKQPL